MASTRRTVAKDINLHLLVEELALASVPGNVELRGFDQSSARVYAPSAEAKVVAQGTGISDDTAQPGELDLHSRDPLTAAQETALDATLSAHSATGRTTSQQSDDKQDTDLTALKVLWDVLDGSGLDGTALTAAQQDQYRHLFGKVLLRVLRGDRIV